jgi:HD-GYP domain-containing protein (c-di-GMP phosphodiesterase class II)
LPDSLLEEIETTGLLHDIGKIAIPEKILLKPGKLTDEEFEIIKKHPELGEHLINGIGKLKLISNWLKSHHERYDGKGYPDGLVGEEIPISSRIIAIADTYDAMTSTRSYRPALSHEEAIGEIKRCSGTQFDPKLAEIFISISDEINSLKQDPDGFYPKYSYLDRLMNAKPAV